MEKQSQNKSQKPPGQTEPGPEKPANPPGDSKSGEQSGASQSKPAGSDITQYLGIKLEGEPASSGREEKPRRVATAREKDGVEKPAEPARSVKEILAEEAQRQPQPPPETPEESSSPETAPAEKDLDFSDFTMDGNYRATYRVPSGRERSEPPAGETPSEEESGEVPAAPETPPGGPPEPPAAGPPEPPQVTFFLVDIYKSQGLYERAWQALETLQELGADPQRLEAERAEIAGLMESSTKEAGETPAPAPEPGSEDSGESRHLAALRKRATRETAAPREEPSRPVADEDQEETQRIAALKRRRGAEAETSPAEPVPAAEEQDEEQARIEALEKRLRQEQSAGEKPEGPAQEPPPLDLPVSPPKPPRRFGRGLWMFLLVVLIGLGITYLVRNYDNLRQRFFPPPAVTEEAPADLAAAGIDIPEEPLPEPEPAPVAAEPPKEAPPPPSEPAPRPPVSGPTARQLFENRKYWEAALQWGQEKQARPGHYTVVLLYACQPGTIVKSYQALSQADDFFLLPRYIGPERCYTLCWGDFPTKAAAEAQFRKIPVWFRENEARPVVKPFAGIRTSPGSRPAPAPAAARPAATRAARSGTPELPVTRTPAPAVDSVEKVFLEAMLDIHGRSPLEQSGEPAAETTPAAGERTQPPPPDVPETLFWEGDYSAAAASWAREKRLSGDRYTVFLLTACQTETIARAFRKLTARSDYFILTRQHEGAECFALCWGDFATQAEAESRLAQVPQWFRDNQAEPALRMISSLLE